MDPPLRYFALALVAWLAIRGLIAAVMPLTDPSEGRYAVIAMAMASRGDWVTPRLPMDGTLVPFLGKPPLFFWAAAASLRLFGQSEWAVRLPSLLGGAGLVALAAWIVGRFHGQETGLRCGWLMLGCGFFFAMSGLVLVDMPLAFFVAGSLLCYYAFLREGTPRLRRYWSLAVFALLAGGFLAKGPVAIALFGLPVFAWTLRFRQWTVLRHHAWLAGTTLFLGLTMPWFGLCELRNPGFLKYFLLNENLLRYTVHNYGDLYGHGHEYFYGSAIWMMAVTLLPWTFWVAWLTWQRLRHPRATTPDPADRPWRAFFLYAVLAQTAFWCLARQLLITYMLPAVPAFCAWMALATRPYGHPAEPPSARNLDLPFLARWGGRLMLVYGVAGLVALPIVNRESGCRQILRRALTVAATPTNDGEIVFARRTPLSAPFYVGERLLDHPKETAEDSASRVMAGGEGHLLVVRDHYLEDLSTTTKGRLKCLSRIGPWWLFSPLPGTGAPPTAP